MPKMIDASLRRAHVSVESLTLPPLCGYKSFFGVMIVSFHL